jgi:hypothetical protein
MKAKVTTEFKGADDGKIHPRLIAVGETIEGDLAQVAVDGGLAKMLGGAAENKMLPGSAEKKTGGRTGAAKPASSPDQGQAKTRKISKRLGAKHTS